MSTPVTSTSPTTSNLNPVDTVKKVEEFYGKFVGKVGFNPYFYLHSLNFFDIKAKVDAKVELTKDEVAKLASIKFDESLAKAPANPVDLYRKAELLAVAEAPAKV